MDLAFAELDAHTSVGLDAHQRRQLAVIACKRSKRTLV
jgi:hypothetical protein